MPSTRLDTGLVSSRDQMVWRTAHTLRTLSTCLDALDDYYEAMGDMPSDVLHPAPHFKECQLENGCLTVTYRSHLLGDQLSPRSMSLADAVLESAPKSPSQCVVKFAEQYGVEGHRIMEVAGVAPELLYCNWEATVGLIGG